MDKEEFEKKMENLSSPQFEPQHHQEQFKATLMNAKRSASLGIYLLALPTIFFVGMIFKTYFGVHLGIFALITELIAAGDKVPILNWVLRILLLGGPFAGVVINFLAITHFHYNKALKEVNFTFKLKWRNIAILILSASILNLFFLYLIVENLAFSH